MRKWETFTVPVRKDSCWFLYNGKEIIWGHKRKAQTKNRLSTDSLFGIFEHFHKSGFFAGRGTFVHDASLRTFVECLLESGHKLHCIFHILLGYKLLELLDDVVQSLLACRVESAFPFGRTQCFLG